MNLRHTWLCIKRRLTGFQPGDIAWYQYHNYKPIRIEKVLIVCPWEKIGRDRVYKVIPWSRISTDEPCPDEVYFFFASQLRFHEVADRETLLTSSIEEARCIGLHMKD